MCDKCVIVKGSRVPRDSSSLEDSSVIIEGSSVTLESSSVTLI